MIINYILTYFETLISLTREMAPYLLLGFLIAGILHVYVPQGAFTRWFGKSNFKSVLYATLLGIPLPLCSCGVIPTGISLYKEGASKGATVSFLISTPQTGVDSIMVTYSLLGLPFALIRPVIALLTGLFGGMAVNMAETDKDNEVKIPPAKNTPSTVHPIRQILDYAFDEFLEDISDWLIIGLVLAGLISVLIPADFFQSTLFANEFSSMLIILLASIPFYVCATGSVPIAAVLLLKGLNPGAVLVFLMAGPATNIATMTVISKTMGYKTLFIYLASIIIGAFGFGLIINHLFPANFFRLGATDGSHHQGFLMNWVEWISLFLLAFILMRVYYLKWKRSIIKKRGMEKSSDQILKVEVEGMSCQNCAVRVESALMELPQINESHANFSENFVEIKGNEIDLEKVKASVEKAGYKYKQVMP